MKPSIIGINVQDLIDDQQQDATSPKGVEVVAVIKDSPAFNANLMRGDIIQRIDDHDITAAQEFFATIQFLAGKTVIIEGLRDGKPIKKSIVLNNRPL